VWASNNSASVFCYFVVFFLGANSISSVRKRDREMMGLKWMCVCLSKCECNGECVSCNTTISSSNARERAREATWVQSCCCFSQLVSGSACSKSGRWGGWFEGWWPGECPQVRGRQRIDQAQQLRQAKQQLTRFIVCLQVATVGTPFPLSFSPLLCLFAKEWCLNLGLYLAGK